MRTLLVVLGGIAGGCAGCSAILGADFDRGAAADAGSAATDAMAGSGADGSAPGRGGSLDGGASDGASSTAQSSGFVDFALPGDAAAAPGVGAVFYAAALTAADANPGLDRTCTAGSAHGDCTPYVCTQPPPALKALPVPISAGPVSVSGMSAPFEIDPTVGGQGAFYALSGSVPAGALVPGELLTVSAPGDAFPAFTAQVSLPPRLDLSSAIPSTAEAGVDTTLTWTSVSGTADLVQITFAEDDGSVQLKAQCSFLLGGGRGTISGAIWEDFLPSTPITVTAAVLATTMASDTPGSSVPGTAAIVLTASTAAYVAPGNGTTTSLTVD